MSVDCPPSAGINGHPPPMIAHHPIEQVIIIVHPIEQVIIIVIHRQFTKFLICKYLLPIICSKKMLAEISDNLIDACIPKGGM